MNQKLRQFKILLDTARRNVENQYIGYPIDLSTPHLIKAALESELNHFRMRGIVFQDFPYEVTCNRSIVQVTLLVTESDLGIDNE